MEQGTNGANRAAPTPIQTTVPKGLKPKEEFRADRKDILLAIGAFVLGYLFVRWLLLSWRGWGVSLFTALYCGTLVCYFTFKKVKIPLAGWFWLAVTVLTGLSYALWAGNGLEPYRGMFLFCTAVYSVITAAGVQIQGKTGNWLFLDGIQAVMIIPFRNLDAQYRSLATLRKDKEKGKGFYSVLLGLFLAVIVLGMVVPLLLEADSGGFSKLLSGFLGLLRSLLDPLTVLELVLTIPVAAYLFGLLFGCGNRRKVDCWNKANAEKALTGLKLLPAATVYTLLGVVCALYLLFIGTQLPYFFSAFSGHCPAGWEVYSQYARRGFFELCGIAAINLSILAAANGCRKPTDTAPKALKVLNGILMLLTLVMVSTAFSKMVLYVWVYGLSMRRLLTCIFVVFLFAVCVGVIVLQRRTFSILRFAAVLGASMFCLFCLSDPDGLVARYNADRYVSGTLTEFAGDILYRSGPAGVGAAKEVLAKTDDPELKESLRSYISDESATAAQVRGTASDNLQELLVRAQG
jgi:hypothetical protein